jgi:hypothetical protein
MPYHAVGERIVTPWLTVIGRNVEGMPLVDVRLRRAGDELQGVRARVRLLQTQMGSHDMRMVPQVAHLYISPPAHICLHVSPVHSCRLYRCQMSSC